MASRNTFIENLKNRWNVKSAFQVVIILIVFSCTGFSVLYVEDQIYKLLNITGDYGFWIRALLFIIITLPIYNVLLLIYGFIFGQFYFFLKNTILSVFPNQDELSKNSELIILGDWIAHFSYAVFDGQKMELKYYTGEK